MNKKDILFFNKKLKYTFHKSTPTIQFVQRVQLSSEETVQRHKLWQLPDTNLPRQLQYINVFHRRKNEVMGDIITSSVLGEQPSQLSSIMPPHSSSRLQLMPQTQNSLSSTSLVQMRANTHVSSSVTDVVDILDVNYDDLFCDYNTLTTVNSVTNTRTIQQTPMFHGCTITNLNITINK